MAYSPADRLPRQFPFRTAHAYMATKRVGSFTPNYCEVFTQPQKLQPRNNFWLEPPNFSCQGSDLFMPFALFTTLPRRVRLSQGNRRLFGIPIVSFLLVIVCKYICWFLLILGVLNPIKLTEGAHLFQR
jgi:hypothetical protein